MVRFIVFLFALAATASMATQESKLTVYAYDAFTTKTSLGEVLRAECEKKYRVKTEFVSFQSVGEALNQIVLEGKNTHADLLVGVDATLLSRARETGLFEKTHPRAEVPSDLKLDSENFFIPFDYGYLALVYDSRRTKPPHDGTMSFREFTREAAFKKRLVVEDARTSPLGLGLLVWTHLLFPDKQNDAVWKDLSNQIFAVSPGWSGAYGMFLSKHADLVVSYTTSPAYHQEKENTDAIRALHFTDGNLRQIEGVGIVKTSPHKAAAEQWIDCLLSPTVQAKIPTTQWMYPVNKTVALPASFTKLPAITKSLEVDADVVEKFKKEWLRQWLVWMMKN